MSSKISFMTRTQGNNLCFGISAEAAEDVLRKEE
jgi:hypothetical protein